MSVLKTYYDEQFRSLIPNSQKMYCPSLIIART